MFKVKNTKDSSCQRKINSCLLMPSPEMRGEPTSMTKRTAVSVLGLWRREGMSGRSSVTKLVLTSADLLTAFRRELSVLECGGRDGRGYSRDDFQQAYNTLNSRMKNNKLKLRKDRQRQEYQLIICILLSTDKLIYKCVILR